MRSSRRWTKEEKVGRRTERVEIARCVKVLGDAMHAAGGTGHRTKRVRQGRQSAFRGHHCKCGPSRRPLRRNWAGLTGHRPLGRPPTAPARTLIAAAMAVFQGCHGVGAAQGGPPSVSRCKSLRHTQGRTRHESPRCSRPITRHADARSGIGVCSRQASHQTHTWCYCRCYSSMSASIHQRWPPPSKHAKY